MIIYYLIIEKSTLQTSFKYIVLLPSNRTFWYMELVHQIDSESLMQSDENCWCCTFWDSIVEMYFYYVWANIFGISINTEQSFHYSFTSNQWLILDGVKLQSTRHYEYVNSCSELCLKFWEAIIAKKHVQGGNSLDRIHISFIQHLCHDESRRDLLHATVSLS